MIANQGGRHYDSKLKKKIFCKQWVHTWTDRQSQGWATIFEWSYVAKPAQEYCKVNSIESQQAMAILNKESITGNLVCNFDISTVISLCFWLQLLFKYYINVLRLNVAKDLHILRYFYWLYRCKAQESRDCLPRHFAHSRAYLSRVRIKNTIFNTEQAHCFREVILYSLIIF